MNTYIEGKNKQRQCYGILIFKMIYLDSVKYQIGFLKTLGAKGDRLLSSLRILNLRDILKIRNAT